MASRRRWRWRWPSWAWGAAAGLVADRWLGEPPVPGRLHPVALFGTAASLLERRLYADDRRRGALFAGLSIAAATGIGRAIDLATAGRSVGVGRAWRATAAAAGAAYVVSAGRGLHDAALEVGAALEAGRLDEARRLLPHLVGRDPDGLTEEDIARAVVESVAENTTDAIVAPALWTAVAGPSGALLHRAADTLDSMVGYRNARYERFGAASARLDDMLAWVPARVSAGLVALVRPSRAAAVGRIVRSDAPAHPSPNAGVAEAAFAAALDIHLGGTNRYGDVVEHRPVLGEGRAVVAADIPRAVALSRQVTWALAGVLAGTAALTTARRRR